MINSVSPTSNSIHGREKCFKHNNFSLTIMQWLCGVLVKDPTSLIQLSEGVSLNPSEGIPYFLE